MINNTLTCAYPQSGHSPSRSPRPRHRRTRVHHSTAVDNEGHTKVGTITKPTAATCSIAATAIAAATAAITTGVPASAAGSNMANGGSVRLIRELPQQDYQSIHDAILAKRLLGHLPPDLAFVDPIFPPDQSSLTYVYSGDDKYERMVYKRPPDLVSNPVLVEAGCGALVRQPVRRWAGRQWLVHALAVVSINPTYMDKLITGSTHQAQGFNTNYTGIFQFELWRFGEWVQVVVDDFLPVLDGKLAFCPTIGNPPQFWPALLEKAYAKCNKAYEAIELGNPLSALTDFTGAICEHFSPPEEVATSGDEFFHVLYRSSVSRSLLVAWRSQHSFRESTIRSTSPGSHTECNYVAPWLKETHSNLMMQGPNLFIITAVAKFPLRDGRMLEVLRIKSPHDPPASWWGDFSLKHDSSWHRVNPTFMENYRPRECVETNEFWMPFLEFCRHFGDLVICSSTQPYTGFNSSQQGSMCGDSSVNLGCDTDGTQLSTEQKYPGGAAAEAGGYHSNLQYKEMGLERSGGIGITVQENDATIKMDTRELRAEDEGSTLFIRRGSSRLHSHLQQQQQQQQKQQQQQQESRTNTTETMGINLLQRGQSQSSDDSTTSAAAVTLLHKQNEQQQEEQQQQHQQQHQAGTQGSIHSSLSQYSCQAGSAQDGHHSTMTREGSIGSNLSNFSNTSLSDTESTNSTSQIKIRLKSSKGTRYHGDRPSSAPAKSLLHHRPSKTFNASMFEARMDYFRPEGSWRTVVRYFSRWDKTTSGGPPCDMDSHSRNPRVPFIVTRADTVNEMVPPALPSKCHVLVSLLQDYRRGAKTANSLLVNIGFRIYKTKTPEKDEKRHLSKLQVISDVTSVNESREITSRFDLDPGHYLLVPYTYHVAQEGGFLVRILAEKDQLTGKTGCALS